MEREKLGSRLGFILLSAGCAIGIGNVWKFPYMAGQNGGGAFVLIYLLFLLALGIPIMTMEFSLGRAAKKSPVVMYKTLEPKGSKWHIHGYFAFAGNLLLMMFYTVVCGWMIQYFVKTASGDFVGMDSVAVGAEFEGMLADPWMLTLYTGIVVLVGFLVCSFGVQKGLERVTKYMMLALLLIMVVLAVRGFFLDGAGEGLRFYLVPSLSKMKSAGVFNVITDAMCQAFFTLSLGIGSMAIFGSYLGKERSLLGESLSIALLDTFVAITAGLIIFPACFTFGVDVEAGPSLIFVTLPNVFNHMAGGRIFGSFFFIFMSFAALSTVFAVFENIISCTQDLFGWSRKRACLIDGIALFVLSLPCVLGFNLLSGFTPFGAGSGVLDLEDFLVSNLLLPIGSLLFVLFCTTRYGWGFDRFLDEANTGKGLKIAKWMRGYIKYVLPVLTAAFVVIAIVTFFI